MGKVNKILQLKTLRRHLGRIVYKWAEKKYGVNARGPVSGFKLVHHPILGSCGVSDFTTRQSEMLEQWHKWMKYKNIISGSL